MPAVAAVELALGDALAERGKSKEATAIFDEVDGVLRELPPDAALEPHLIIAELWCEAGLYSMAQRSLDKVSPAIEKVAERDPRRAARALCHFGEVCLSQSRFDEATAYFDRARALARTKELSDVFIEANALLALAQAEAGDTQNANESLRTATHAQGIEDVSLATLALMDHVQGELLLQQKAMDEADEYLQSAHFAFWQERGPASYLTSRCQALLDKLAVAAKQTSTQQ